MSKQSKYVSRMPDENGIIHWSDVENDTWRQLVERQMTLLPGHACQEYMQGLETLNLPTDRIPQLDEINAVLKRTTGWQVAQVPALINFDKFFNLLANKQFPVATFIRTPEEFDYLQEPDIFHEIFGHCPLLTNPTFAHFTHVYGQLGAAASKQERVYLARLYWFTVEFGLMNTADGLRIYGGGILSSPGETHYALHSEEALREPMDVLKALRTPYRIDIMQPQYYILDQFNDLFDITQMDIMSLVSQAMQMGLLPARFEKAAS
ncbi:phenylalanine 4-monooxygenase [Bowmanella sp. JS7-9]|uniref:Phenylalanine-4-hydroxylase n=1 Tax=Pseudobowmanella zhangzhouensis TaxID=1537679 RepID=A0ABW1XJI8_9ALTE|nr:phenylalanine 4-monooxygenase [Bowmanella sp. JS7-9]TBX25808.1 phenylalanine 4-monooxygenase [Bowmanella sp. JS7-9]